jgi:hypothetical protein
MGRSVDTKDIAIEIESWLADGDQLVICVDANKISEQAHLHAAWLNWVSGMFSPRSMEDIMHHLLLTEAGSLSMRFTSLRLSYK